LLQYGVAVGPLAIARCSTIGKGKEQAMPCGKP
jgi:hypothetical protein